mgnify:CR=1 FL=1
MLLKQVEQKAAWKYLILSLCILSILDLQLTVYEIELGIAYEYNLFLARLLHIGYIPFILVKINTTLICCAILLAGIDKILAKLGILVCNFIYLFIFVYHIIGITIYS